MYGLYSIGWIYIIWYGLSVVDKEMMISCITEIKSYILSIVNIEEPFSDIPIKGILEVPSWYTWRHFIAQTLVYSTVIGILGSLYVFKRHVDSSPY
jgi:hypothetical protein